ncbi:MAG TPA: R3H domain-containing nucleic acid-binding protein [Patescibacteria group bacterium]
MQQQTKEIIKKTVEEIIEKMGFTATVEISETTEEDSIVCNIATGSDSHFLIGQHGINLQALQHIARLIVRKRSDDKVRFILDINDYRQQKNQTVIEQAEAAAKQAIDEHRSVVMKPMSTYERRIVHMELSKNSNVITESIGEGEGRKIVVKPTDTL